MFLKVGDRVSAYGFDMNSIADYHNGCRGTVVQVSYCNDCYGVKTSLYGVEFNDLSHGWFHPKQLRKIVRKK